ncbi:MAG TPA: transposase [Pirellulales bacterium]|nr:transposase [Pirellulales bacterium]
MAGMDATATARGACLLRLDDAMMSFELFDPRAEVAIRQGNLPHWYQPGATYFVTFRTADSVPESLLRSWHGRRDRWLREHGIDPSSAWKAQLERATLEHEDHTTFTREFMAYFDRGHGACPLGDPRLAERVAACLHHFAGQRYQLGDFVVMPNHVHVLACLLGTTEIESQCRSWKKFSAREINQLLGRRGRFWQEESFDHLVRSEEHFAHFQRYIGDNPEHAGLVRGQFLLHTLQK